ncbi:hypothetical protein F4802DRAFT_448058 [Xylaria palmicola]|nr:hypothetical protein F4802DRAFT_448058 [Xylaria palmicola]
MATEAAVAAAAVADISTSISTATSAPKTTKKSHELARSVIKAPPHSYAHLELLTTTESSSLSSGADEAEALDALQVRLYCASALRQFLGATGLAIPLDVLKVEGQSCWLRLPRDDLGAFAAAITAWQGTTQDGVHSMLRIRGCSDWLGALVGQQDEWRLWTD